LVEGKPISIGNVAYVIGINSKKLFRWYKDHLSGFSEAERDGSLTKYDIRTRDEHISVPILKPENMGPKMAVDEKTIDGTCYTVLSNRETNKIAMMAATLQTKELAKLFKHFDITDRMKVKSLTRDMAPNYDWLGRQMFMNCYQVIDKFHVIKNAMEQLQAIRIELRQKALAKRREAKEQGIVYQEEVFSNGDTELQLLARSRGLLFITQNKWSQHQKQRAAVLFEKYPNIKTAYSIINQFRRWYSPPSGARTYPKTIQAKKIALMELIQKMKETKIDQLQNLAYMIKTHLQQIIHYFKEKETNAKAEALNQNLQRFITINYGARNSDFFFYRVKLHFS
jgi:transposase